MRIALLALLACLAACDEDNRKAPRCNVSCIPQPGFYADADADGFGDPGLPFDCAQVCTYRFVDNAADCDDDDARKNPDAHDQCSAIDGEIYNEDLNCNGLADATLTALPDGDGDGDAPTGATSVQLCAERSLDSPAPAPPAGYVATTAPTTDCDDADPTRHGHAEEVDGDGVDQDCDGVEACPVDADGDGFTVLASVTTAPDVDACRASPGLEWDPNTKDCDDNARHIHPGAAELCADPDTDRSCDNVLSRDQPHLAADRVSMFYDRDGDGYGDGAPAETCPTADRAWVDGDCDDLNPQVFPNAAEVCDEADNDCDRAVDHLDDDGPPARTWYADVDGDGWGNSAITRDQCGPPPGLWAERGGDCDDSRANIAPDAPEACDRIDNDCDGEIDHVDPEGPATFTWYTDNDGDGWGDAATAATTCDPAGPTQVDRAGDCDDGRADVSPAAAEACDGVDNDCDGLAEADDPDGPAFTTWYTDRDGDGWGDAATAATTCDPAGTNQVDRPGDCDDRRADVSPAAAETCAEPDIDKDCDGVPAADQPSRVADRANTWPDTDADGWGDRSAPATLGCPVEGRVANALDCDDGADAVRPDAPEVCNGLDDDCDGAADANDPGYQGPRLARYADEDGDGYGDGAVEVCDPATPGTVSNATDCDDADAAVHPGADDPPDDEVDSDCDGLELCSVDADRDAHAALTPSASLLCPFTTTLWTPATEDCDDSSALVLPGAPERCDAPLVDHDCDGRVGLLEPEAMEGAALLVPDADGDGDGATDASPALACPAAGLVPPGGDCDDRDPAVSSTTLERCNAADDDCDGLVDLADPSYVGDPGQLWHLDADGDGVGGDEVAQSCDGAPGPGWVARSGDCDDARPDVGPGAPESCADLTTDRDCDGLPGGAQLDHTDAAPLYPDADRDGRGAQGASYTLTCPGAGWSATADDCDDSDPAVLPGAPEVCDGEDDDCDGVPDDGTALQTWYADADGDLHGDAGAPVATCDPALTPGVVQDNTDCDDGDATVHPAAPERCDGRDEDCSGAADDVAPGAPTPDWYADADGDGHGGGAPIWACEAPGALPESTDCDDTSADAAPGRTERCDGLDNDCDGLTDNEDAPPMAGATTLWYTDADGDGHGVAAFILGCAGPAAPAGYAAAPDDCDDGDHTVSPSEPERCDGADNDCDRRVDSQDPDVSADPFAASAAVVWLRDDDNDGVGAAAGAVYACDDAPTGYVALGVDCDDARGDVYPGAPETCAEPAVDHDCDGLAAADLPALLIDAVALQPDRDDDGYGADVPPTSGCAAPGWSTEAGDCDDRDPTRRPGAPELCNAADDDCDRLVDDADPELDPSLPGAVAAWRDVDEDGFGDAAAPRSFCAVLAAGWVDDDDDCDDDDDAVHPDATEVCNDLDDNCDALVDEADPSVSLTAWYADGDGDGFGGGAPVYDCAQPAGRSTDGSDCDDARSRVYPGAPERCDGLDNDCDGPVDNADVDSPPSGGTKLWNADLDGDGFGDPADGSVLACDEDTPPPGFVANDDDCDNHDPFIHPSAKEVCNAGVDDDCDGLRDSEDEDVFGDPSATVVWYVDADNDGFVSGTLAVAACTNAPTGYLASPANLVFDCDDGDESSYPGAPELCDEIDQDCDEGRTWNFDTVAFHPATGSPIDLTACLTGATDNPGLCAVGDLDVITPSEGVLHFCQRTVDWYRLRIQTSTPLEVLGHHEAGGEVVLTNKEAGGIRHDWVIRSTSDLTLQDLVIRDSGHKDVEQARSAVDHDVAAARALTILRCDFVDNGLGSGASVRSYGGGAVWTYGTPVRIEDSHFVGNHSAGSSLRVTPDLKNIVVSEVTVLRSTFTRNETTENGAGIYTFGPSVLMKDVAFEGNIASPTGLGGAAFLHHGDDSFYPIITLHDVHFHNNTGVNGGALHASAPSIKVLGTDHPSTFTHNSGHEGGAVNLSGQDIEITNVVLSDNSGRDGSAMFVGVLNGVAATLDIDRAVFSANTALNQSALFININNTPFQTTITNTIFSENEGLNSSSIYTTKETTITNTLFSENKSNSDPYTAAVTFNSFEHLRLEHVDLADNVGGGIVASSASDVTLTDCTLTGNTSSKNAALYIRSGPSDQRQGTLTVTDTTFADNHNTNPTLRGGAVYLEPHTVSAATPSLRATFERTLFDGNTSQLTGGAIAVWGRAALTLDDTDFVDNEGRGSAVSLEYNPATGDPALSIAPTCDFDDNTPDDLWTSGTGAIDYVDQTSCTARTGCTP